MKINGQTVLITGASSGIGAACAEAFAGHGCDLLLVARRTDKLEDMAKQIQSTAPGISLRTDALDVRDRAAVQAWFAALPEQWSAPHILVNNAGLARGLAPFFAGEVEDWEEMVDTNIKGLLYVSRTVVPGMVERGRGHVINIGSVAGHEAYAGGNVYCATKYAVTGLNRGMAIDTLGTGVRVSSVDPGLVDTEFATVRFHGDDERAAGVYKGLEPLHAEDVADAVLFCATRPPHANVREMVLLSTAQAGAVHVHRQS